MKRAGTIDEGAMAVRIPKRACEEQSARAHAARPERA
jgi:hypothetical protein